MPDHTNPSVAAANGTYIILKDASLLRRSAAGNFLFLQLIPKDPERPYILVLGMDSDTMEIMASIVLDFALSSQVPSLFLHPYLFQSVASKEVMHLFSDELKEDVGQVVEIQKQWQQATGHSLLVKKGVEVRVLETEFELLDHPKMLDDKALSDLILGELFESDPPKKWFVLEDQPELIEDFDPHKAGSLSDLQAEWHERAYMAMRTEPEWLFMVINKLVEYYEPIERVKVSKFYFAYLMILRESLYRLGVDVARGFPYAEWLNHKLQQTLVDEVLVPEMGQLLQQDVVDALARSKLPIENAFKEAQFNLADYYGRFQKDRSVPDMGRYLDELAADGLTDIFEVFEHFVSHLRLMLQEERFFLLEELARTQHEKVQELVGLFNLHPDPEIRASVRNHMAHFVGPHWVSPVTLRRLILCRNWLPPKERPHLDRLVKLNRLARVNCAPTGDATLSAIFTSTIDGAGSCGVWLFSKMEGLYFHTHLMLKQQEGVQESWCIKVPSEEAFEEEIAQLKDSSDFGWASTEFLARFMGHFLAKGHQCQTVPHGSVLQVVEQLGDLDWEPQLLTLESLKPFCEEHDAQLTHDTMASMDQILEALSAELPNKKFYENSPSGIYQYRGLDTWFDESHELDAFLQERFGEPIQWMYRVFEVAGAIADHVLEKNRELWQERFMLNAFYYLEVEGLESFTWRIYAQDARALSTDLQLSQIPVMQNIAMRSLQASFDRHRFGEKWQRILSPKTVPFPVKKMD